MFFFFFFVRESPSKNPRNLQVFRNYFLNFPQIYRYIEIYSTYISISQTCSLGDFLPPLHLPLKTIIVSKKPGKGGLFRGTKISPVGKTRFVIKLYGFSRCTKILGDFEGGCVILIPAGKGGPFHEALLDHKDFWDVSHWTLELTQLLSLQSRYWKLMLSTADMKVKNDDFFFWEVRENLKKVAKKNPGNGHNWHNLKFLHFIAPCHTCLNFVEVEFEQLLREMAGNARQAEGAVVWGGIAPETGVRTELVELYIRIVYLFLKSRALWNTLGL